jgi:glutaredoxin-dependent peroxiredoxin
MIDLGNKAPDFKLFDTDRKERSLSEFSGKKVVLAFFPGAFTGGCTKEMCALRDSMSNFINLNSQIVAISVDSPFANKAFAEANKLNFPILSDYTRTVINQYCGVHNDFVGLKGYSASKRAVFVLDQSGIVKYKWVSDDPGKEPPYDEITKTLNSI